MSTSESGVPPHIRVSEYAGGLPWSSRRLNGNAMTILACASSLAISRACDGCHGGGGIRAVNLRMRRQNCESSAMPDIYDYFPTGRNSHSQFRLPNPASFLAIRHRMLAPVTIDAA
jgi:hypothetical protein